MLSSTSLHDFIGNGLRGSILTLILLFLALIAFLMLVSIPRSVIGSGELSSMRAARSVMHDTGGVILDLPVLEGQMVEKGDPILRFDTSALSAEREALATEIVVLSAERESLSASGDPVDFDQFSSNLHVLAKTYALEQDLKDQSTRAVAETAAKEQVVSQLQEQQQALRAEKNHRIRERKAKREEHALIKELISRRQPLVDQGYASKAEMNTIKIQEASLRGAIERLSADIDSLTSQINKADSEATRIPNELDIERLTRLSELSRQIADKNKRMTLVDQAIVKAVVTAPVSGQVIELHPNTVASYIGPGQKIAMIAPFNEDLIIDVKLEPRDIDLISPGMKAKVVFSAFPQRSLPEIITQIESVTNDVLIDPMTGRKYYNAKLRIPENIAALLTTENAQHMVSGMPVQVFVTVNRVTFFDYFTGPLRQSFHSAFRA